MTSPQIATRLFISPRTVQTHISHSLRKLDLRSRVELATTVAGTTSMASHGERIMDTGSRHPARNERDVGMSEPRRANHGHRQHPRGTSEVSA